MFSPRPSPPCSLHAVIYRDYAVDAYFVGIGTILVLTSVSGAPTFIRSYFGFMNRDIGAGFCLIFSGFITTNFFQIGKYSTWVAIVAFASGLFLMLSPPIKYLCTGRHPRTAVRRPRNRVCWKGQGAEAQTKTDPGLVPEDAFGADTEK